MHVTIPWCYVGVLHVASFESESWKQNISWSVDMLCKYLNLRYVSRKRHTMLNTVHSFFLENGRSSLNTLQLPFVAYWTVRWFRTLAGYRSWKWNYLGFSTQEYRIREVRGETNNILLAHKGREKGEPVIRGLVYMHPSVSCEWKKGTGRTKEWDRAIENQLGDQMTTNRSRRSGGPFEPSPCGSQLFFPVLALSFPSLFFIFLSTACSPPFHRR